MQEFFLMVFLAHFFFCHFATIFFFHFFFSWHLKKTTNWAQRIELCSNSEFTCETNLFFSWNKLLTCYQQDVSTSAVVGMIFPCRHVNIIWSRRRHACRHNSSFKIEWNTRQKTVKTKVSRVIHAYFISLPSYLFILLLYRPWWFKVSLKK